MKKYETIEIKWWADHKVYCYNFATGDETIFTETYINKVINEFNDKGYFVSASYIEYGKVVYIMTKIIEE